MRVLRIGDDGRVAFSTKDVDGGGAAPPPAREVGPALEIDVGGPARAADRGRAAKRAGGAGGAPAAKKRKSTLAAPAEPVEFGVKSFAEVMAEKRGGEGK